MNIAAVADFTGTDRDTLKRTGAAKDFEALLIAQMLKSMREGSSGWLGSGDDDQASDAAIGLGEESLAKAISSGGGLGLAAAIQKNIR